ncbi:fatty acid desaturase [Peredibacter sp. HCB2-198]|uniref:fatty acid desaturase n=1 Tax=Peredibacter sp. HCB2-198 TaxID=3383025 RepID=UPI0038B6B1F3
MTSTQTYLKIKREPLYLLRVYLIEMLVFSLFITLLYSVRELATVNLSLGLIALPLAIIFGCMVASFIHNASHGNVGNRYLNRAVGEFCGTWVLYGFTNFILVHLLHHQYSDEELDPVNPKGMSFLIFLSAPMRYMIVVAKKYLFLQHGKSANYALIMNTQTVIFHINLVLKLIFWYLLFGKTLFLFFYLPAFFSNVAILAHINYVCHRDMEDGTVEMVNLNHNLYYKVANFITFGGYFHKSHHMKLNVFNPMKTAQETLPTLKTASYNGNFIARYFDLHNIWGEGQKNKVYH